MVHLNFSKSFCLFTAKGRPLSVIFCLLVCALLRSPNAFAIYVEEYPDCPDFFRTLAVGIREWAQVRNLCLYLIYKNILVQWIVHNIWFPNNGRRSHFCAFCFTSLLQQYHCLQTIVDTKTIKSRLKQQKIFLTVWFLEARLFQLRLSYHSRSNYSKICQLPSQ